MKLLDLKKEKYKNLPKNKLGVATKIIFKYKGSIVYIMPYRFFLFPFFTKDVEKGNIDAMGEFYESYQDFIKGKYSAIDVIREKVRGEEIFLNVNGPLSGIILKFCKGLPLENRLNLISTAFFVFSSTKYTYNVIRMFYDIYRKDLKAIKIMFDKIIYWLLKDLPSEKLPNCVDQFILNKEVNMEDYLELEEIKEIIERFEKDLVQRSSSGRPKFKLVRKYDSKPAVGYEELREYLLKLYGPGGELELNNFDESYLSDFKTLDSLINIYYSFYSKFYYYDYSKTIIKHGEGVDYIISLESGGIMGLHSKNFFYYALCDFFKNK